MFPPCYDCTVPNIVPDLVGYTGSAVLPNVHTESLPKLTGNYGYVNNVRGGSRGFESSIGVRGIYSMLHLLAYNRYRVVYTHYEVEGRCKIVGHVPHKIRSRRLRSRTSSNHNSGQN